MLTSRYRDGLIDADTAARRVNRVVNKAQDYADNIERRLRTRKDYRSATERLSAAYRNRANNLKEYSDAYIKQGNMYNNTAYSRSTYMGLSNGLEISRVKGKRTKSIRDIQAQLGRIQALTPYSRSNYYNRLKRAREIGQTYIDRMEQTKTAAKYFNPNKKWNYNEERDRYFNQQYSRRQYMGLGTGG